MEFHTTCREVTPISREKSFDNKALIYRAVFGIVGMRLAQGTGRRVSRRSTTVTAPSDAQDNEATTVP
ncbi:hypothetical protein GCM10028812_17530 [Ancylobacter sonchi]